MVAAAPDSGGVMFLGLRAALLLILDRPLLTLFGLSAMIFDVFCLFDYTIRFLVSEGRFRKQIN